MLTFLVENWHESCFLWRALFSTPPLLVEQKWANRCGSSNTQWDKDLFIFYDQTFLYVCATAAGLLPFAFWDPSISHHCCSVAALPWAAAFWNALLHCIVYCKIIRLHYAQSWLGDESSSSSHVCKTFHVWIPADGNALPLFKQKTSLISTYPLCPLSTQG